MASSTKKKRSGNPAKASARTTTERSGNPAAAAPAATARDWIAGARLRTLSLAIAPVALGTGVAYWTAGYNLPLALLALAVAVFLQIGVNYANDYSDGVRGTDRYRVGPSRLTGSGAAKPRQVLTVALVFFGLGAAAGLAVVILSGQYWLLAVGALALVAAWFYTGGRKPYGYSGFGELIAFLFFGPIATVGTTYVQIGSVPFESVLGGVILGLFSAAILLVNNIRDLDQDARVGKKTLAVRLGNRPARILFAILLALPFVALIWFVVLFPAAPLLYGVLLITLPVTLIVLTARTAQELVLALQLTSLGALLMGVGLAVAVAF